MTRLEFLKTLNTGMEVRNFLHSKGDPCKFYQKTREGWQHHCLLEPYRGEEGCAFCEAEYWEGEFTNM